MAATAHKLTASSPCNNLPVTCYPWGSAVSATLGMFPQAGTRGCQSWQQLLLPWQKPTYVQVPLSAQPGRLPTVPPVLWATRL